MKIGILLSPKMERGSNLLSDIITFLKENNQEVFLTAFPEQVLPNYTSVATVATSDLAMVVDALFSIGGDGTFLSAARLMAHTGKPVLGIHVGGLGFLAEISPANFMERLQAFLTGDYAIEERHILSAKIHFPDHVAEHFAINDFVIDKGPVATMIKIHTYVDDEFLNTYRADGIIIATPTGSTAYSLSAGGPIITPELQVVVISPICPHSLSVRPVVISSDRTVMIDCREFSDAVTLVEDGQVKVELGAAQKVEISQAQFPLRIIRFTGASFFHTLRTKLNWGRDVRES